MVGEAIGRGIGGVLDESSEGVGGTDGVLAGNDSKRGKVSRSLVDTLGNGGSDELEDSGANGAGHNIGSGDLIDELVLVGTRVDGAVAGNSKLLGALGADFNDLVGGVRVDGVHKRLDDISENDVIARVVEEAGDKATAYYIGRESSVSKPLFSPTR